MGFPSPVQMSAAGMWISRHRSLALEGLLRAPYLDLPGLGFRPLGQRDLQNALLIVGVHVLRIHRVGKLEGTEEGAIPALNAMKVLFLLFLFELALALDRQCVVFHADV